MSIPKWLFDKPKGYIKHKCGCAICGKKNKKQLTFHHLEPVNKKFNISDISNMGIEDNLDMREKELKKCIVVCKTCHSTYFHPTYSYLRKHNNFFKNNKIGWSVNGRENFAKTIDRLIEMVLNRNFCEHCGERLKRKRLVYNRDFSYQPHNRVKERYDFSTAYNIALGVHNLCTKCAIKYKVEQDNLKYVENILTEIE